MRELKNHIVDKDQSHQLRVQVLDEPGQGNACHEYFITTDWIGGGGKGLNDLRLSFQNGPLKEVGVNGITHEALLAILIDRLQGFQSGPYACQDNADALTSLYLALGFLQKRTISRLKRGVEGTHEV